MTGKIAATESSLDTSAPTRRLVEYERRKPGASGTPIVLADGQQWLLANPTYRATSNGLTQPSVDHLLDVVFDCSVLATSLRFTDFFELAGQLLKANYDLGDDELSHLLSVSAGAETREFIERILSALFGTDSERTYTSWVRASLLTNGLEDVEIPARDLTHVLAILVATKRTVPLSTFAEACRLAESRARLEALI
jgi:hypothetical protein